MQAAEKDCQGKFAHFLGCLEFYLDTLHIEKLTCISLDTSVFFFFLIN